MKRFLILLIAMAIAVPFGFAAGYLGRLAHLPSSLESALVFLSSAVMTLVVIIYMNSPSSPRSTGEVYDPKDESDLPGWER